MHLVWLEKHFIYIRKPIFVYPNKQKTHEGQQQRVFLLLYLLAQ